MKGIIQRCGVPLALYSDRYFVFGQPQQGAFIPVESAPMVGLREPIRQVIRSYIEKMKPGHEVTLDVDAHLVETNTSSPAIARYITGLVKELL